jgi:hypothetical protein
MEGLLGEDMARQGYEGRLEVEGGVECPLNHGRSQHLKGSGEGNGIRRFGNHLCIVRTHKKATAAVATADHGRN